MDPNMDLGMEKKIEIRTWANLKGKFGSRSQESLLVPRDQYYEKTKFASDGKNLIRKS
jgi:hypothetical protein